MADIPTSPSASTPPGAQKLESNLTQANAAVAESMYKGLRSTLTFIIGKSGRGKSTAMRNLDPSKTFHINVMGKLLPFPKGLAWNQDNKNALITADAGQIVRVITDISRQGVFENVVIDDCQYIMATEFFDKALIKGYDKFASMGQHFWNILVLASKLRPGLKIYMLGHEDDTGGERKLKTLGKMVEDKGSPEGLATIVLWAETRVESGKRIYYFDTQTDGITTAKSPFEMFPDRIDNDIDLVSKRIDEYYKGVSLKDSKLKFIP